jgi:hypothetical protein
MPIGDKTSIEVIHPPLPDGIVSLREYVDTRLAAMESHFDMRLGAIDRATAIAVTTMDKRLDAMNEFRDALRDTTARLATRDELLLSSQRFTELLERVEKDLLEVRALAAGAVSREDYAATCDRTQASLAEIRQYRVEALVTRAEYDAEARATAADIDSLKISRATLAGKAEQSSVNIALLLSAISAVLGIGGFLTGAVGLVLKFFGG